MIFRGEDVLFWLKVQILRPGSEIELPKIPGATCGNKEGESETGRLSKIKIDRDFLEHEPCVVRPPGDNLTVCER